MLARLRGVSPNERLRGLSLFARVLDPVFGIKHYPPSNGAFSPAYEESWSFDGKHQPGIDFSPNFTVRTSTSAYSSSNDNDVYAFGHAEITVKNAAGEYIEFTWDAY